jgi:NAD(P)-dependent dehydrogenase (short-subunit alcohol dehydrogenase family)
MNSYIEKIFSLKGKVAVITGASSGIGSSIAQAFSSADASVVGIARSLKPEQSNQHWDYRQCDILDFSAFRILCKDICNELGSIDILVNSAGVTFSISDHKSNLELFNQTLATNLTAAYNCCDVITDFMRPGGSIINLTSIGSYLGFPRNPAYAASKGGVRILTKALALDYAPKKIRVNNIVPGYIRTAMTEKSYLDKTLNHERIDRMIIQRWGKTEDLIGAAIYLASDASSYVTGTDLIVDGGWTAKGL